MSDKQVMDTLEVLKKVLTLDCDTLKVIAYDSFEAYRNAGNNSVHEEHHRMFNLAGAILTGVHGIQFTPLP